jgi:hypothetical protein
MLVFDDEDGRATALAEGLHERLEQLAVYERERRQWLPLPELGPVVPSGAAVYMSTLRPSGAQYAVLESVALGS